MTQDYAERITNVVRWLKLSRGWSAKELAAMLGIEKAPYFSMICSGKRNPPPGFLDNLAALDNRLDPEYLQGRSGDMLKPGNEQPNPDDLVPKVRFDKKASPAPEAPGGLFIPGELVALFTDMAATIRSQQETIRAIIGGEAASQKNKNSVG